MTRVSIGYDGNRPNGVWLRVAKLKGKRAPELKKRLDEEYLAGRSTDYSEWWQYAQKFWDWTTLPTLLALWRGNDAVDYFVENLKRITSIAVPLIDAAV